VVLAAGLLAPFVNANRFGSRIRSALESALDRRVDIGDVHFDLFRGPGFSVSNVVIHEDPAIGLEPIAYVTSIEAVPRLWSLWTGKLEFSSIRLDDAHINLSKTGPASEAGRWNFEALFNRPIITTLPTGDGGTIYFVLKST
jgi:AsmA protein